MDFTQRFFPIIGGQAILKISTFKDWYMQIVHSYRDGQNNKHKMITELGRFDETRYCKVKEHLKDWVRMGRALVVISEIKLYTDKNVSASDG